MILRHVDTCLPCYLQDHHNRDGETLFSAAIDGNTTFAMVHDMVLAEFDAREMPDGFDYYSASLTIAKYFERYDRDAFFDGSLDVPDPDLDDCSSDSCYAYFVLFH